MTNPDGSFTFAEFEPDCLPGAAFDKRIAQKRQAVDGTPIGKTVPPYSTDIRAAQELVKGLHHETHEAPGDRIFHECPWEAIVGEKGAQRGLHCAEGYTEAHALAVGWWDYARSRR